MSRVQECQQSTANFISAEPSSRLAPPPARPDPESSRELLSQDRPRSCAARVLTRIGGEIASQAERDRAAHEARRRKEVQKLVLKLLPKLADSGLVTAAGTSQGGLLGLQQLTEKLSFMMLPATSVWTLLSGLSQIGRAHLEANAEGERFARMLGFCQTLGLALDDPQLAPAELLARARSAGYPSHHSGLAQNHARLRVSQRFIEHQQALVDRYQEGASQAAQLVSPLSLGERAELAARLATVAEGDSSAARLVAWHSRRPAGE